MLTRIFLLFLALAAHANDGDGDGGNACVRPAIGQSSLVNFPLPPDSPTGIPAQYRLSRPAEKYFVVEVNVHYEAAPGYDGPFPANQVSAKYREKLAACLAENGVIYRDSASGQRLELRLTSDAAVPAQTVQIGSRDVRSNSKLYQSDAGCALMLHESLHLVGLVDEYPEPADTLDAQLVIAETGPDGQRVVHTRDLKVPSPDCRAIGPATSVMYRQAWALSSAAQNHFTATKCGCEKGYDCHKVAAGAFGATSCPFGSSPREVRLDLFDGEKVETKATASEFTLTATAKPIAGHVSLLFPAHFRAITEPGCQNSNSIYYACARNAYRFSKLPESLSSLPIPNVGCLPKPPECATGKFDWLK